MIFEVRAFSAVRKVSARLELVGGRDGVGGFGGG